MIDTDDAKLGKYVYCKQHVAPHNTGWCTVGNDEKIPLKAEDNQSAFWEVADMGLTIHRHCEICYTWLSDWDRYRDFHVPPYLVTICEECKLSNSL
jgi:hypothetical protein